MVVVIIFQKINNISREKGFFKKRIRKNSKTAKPKRIDEYWRVAAFSRRNNCDGQHKRQQSMIKTTHNPKSKCSIKFVVIPDLHLHPLVLYLLASNQNSPNAPSSDACSLPAGFGYTIHPPFFLTHHYSYSHQSSSNFHPKNIYILSIITVPNPQPLFLFSKFCFGGDPLFYLWSLKATTQRGRGPPCQLVSSTITLCSNRHLDLL